MRLPLAGWCIYILLIKEELGQVTQLLSFTSLKISSLIFLFFKIEIQIHFFLELILCAQILFRIRGNQALLNQSLKILLC